MGKFFFIFLYIRTFFAKRNLKHKKNKKTKTKKTKLKLKFEAKKNQHQTLMHRHRLWENIFSHDFYITALVYLIQTSSLPTCIIYISLNNDLNFFLSLSFFLYLTHSLCFFYLMKFLKLAKNKTQSNKNNNNNINVVQQQINCT